MEFSPTLFRRTSDGPNRSDPYSFNESLAWSRSIHQHERGAVFPAKCCLTTVSTSAARADLPALGRRGRSLRGGSVYRRRNEVVAVQVRYEVRCRSPVDLPLPLRNVPQAHGFSTLDVVGISSRDSQLVDQ